MFSTSLLNGVPFPQFHHHRSPRKLVKEERKIYIDHESIIGALYSPDRLISPVFLRSRYCWRGSRTLVHPLYGTFPSIKRRWSLIERVIIQTGQRKTDIFGVHFSFSVYEGPKGDPFTVCWVVYLARQTNIWDRTLWRRRGIGQQNLQFCPQYALALFMALVMSRWRRSVISWKLVYLKTLRTSQESALGHE